MLIIFDLDGTLIDSSKDLAISMNATRRHVGMAPLDPSIIYSYVGNGAEVLVRRALGKDTPEQVISEAHRFFLEFYRAHALEHTQLYPGIREMVEVLSRLGHVQAVLTNKPVRISRDIISALKLQDHFVQIYGGNSFENKKPDPIGVMTLMQDSNCTGEETVMVGDSAVDVLTARNAGIRAIGVTWGFQPDSFHSIPPDHLIGTPRELLDFVCLSKNDLLPDLRRRLND